MGALALILGGVLMLVAVRFGAGTAVYGFTTAILCMGGLLVTGKRN